MTSTPEQQQQQQQQRQQQEKKRKTVSSVVNEDGTAAFGSRLLTDQSDVFTHNAWDSVEMTPEALADAEEKIAKQREKPVPADMAEEYNASPGLFWDRFYESHDNRFFKDRHWLRVEFPELFALCRGEEEKEEEKESEASKDDVVRIFEIGCGAGNTIFPLLAELRGESAEDAENKGEGVETVSPPAEADDSGSVPPIVPSKRQASTPASSRPPTKNVFIYGCDFSSTAVNVVKSSPEYDTSKCNVFQWDLTSTTLPEHVEPGSIDMIMLIFVLSAIHPDTWSQAIDNLCALLKPGGVVCFRDYGRYDLAQVRFKSGRLLQDNFYVRGDGTRVYFFTQEEISTLFGSKFQIEQNAVDRRLLVNRSKKITMQRVWLQGKFRKPT
ncbi:methyltransferase [Ramicandelaber brevisporus]|nr:methyltransferase [Ramicandelaber brevisporus]